jgi:SPOR domain
MNKFLILALVLFFNTAIAQKDSIVVNKDSRLDMLTHKQAVVNKRATIMTKTGLYQGFRLQVITTNNRNQAFQLKNSLLTNYPNEKAYVLFQSPYFKVRFGNYLHRGDAEKMRKELNKQIPTGVFVVEDTIEYTPIAEEDIK